MRGSANGLSCHLTMPRSRKLHQSHPRSGEHALSGHDPSRERSAVGVVPVVHGQRGTRSPKDQRDECACGQWGQSPAIIVWTATSISEKRQTGCALGDLPMRSEGQHLALSAAGGAH